MESHKVSIEIFTCEIFHGIPWSIKTGTLFCRIALKDFIRAFGILGTVAVKSSLQVQPVQSLCILKLTQNCWLHLYVDAVVGASASARAVRGSSQCVSNVSHRRRSSLTAIRSILRMRSTAARTRRMNLDL